MAAINPQMSVTPRESLRFNDERTEESQVEVMTGERAVNRHGGMQSRLINRRCPKGFDHLFSRTVIGMD